MAREVTPEQIEMLDAMVARARKAADIIATYDQARVDRLCQAVAAAVVDMKVWTNLADEAVDETGLGDKVTKRNKRNKLKLILRDCLRQKSVGVIEEIPEKGIVKYAKPVGVIASLVPTTNPCLTPRRPGNLRHQGPGRHHLQPPPPRQEGHQQVHQHHPRDPGP